MDDFVHFFTEVYTTICSNISCKSEPVCYQFVPNAKHPRYNPKYDHHTISQVTSAPKGVDNSGKSLNGEKDQIVGGCTDKSYQKAVRMPYLA